MKTETLEIRNKNTVLPGILWLPEDTPKAILQITHGMTEHIGRYTTLAECLTTNGIAVAGFDLRGHGINTSEPGCASFGENGWEASLEDMHLCYLMLEKRLYGLPHYMLGFSLGSFLLREYLNTYNDPVTGAIIIGTGHQPSAVLTIMMAIVKGQIKQTGFDKTTPLIQKLSFENYNQKFAPNNRTSSNWLCADHKELDIYLADEFCRDGISAGLFWQLLGSMKRTGSKNAYKNWKKNIPVLLISGQDDPVGNCGKGVQCVKTAMEKSGMKHVTMQLFVGARHDLLHEGANGCAEEARRIIVKWLLA